MFCSRLFMCLVLTTATAIVGCESTDPGKTQTPTVTTVDPSQPKPPADSGPVTSVKPGMPSVATPTAGPVAPTVNPLPRVDKMELESFPSAVNLDEKPGPDGVTLKLRLYSLDTPLAFALTQGDMEIVLYEGSIREQEIGSAKPFHIWRFSAKQMSQSGRKSIVGWHYAMSLNWGDNVPTTSTVTLVARIPRPNSTPIYALPVHLAMGPR